MTLNEAGEQAFRLPADGGPLFAQIKGDERSRIKETAVDAEALLPDGPYDLWRESDEARFVSELANAFARNPRLPKFLKANVVVETIAQGIGRGLFVAELARPDGSRRTWWREAPPREVMEDGQLRVLAELPGRLLAPGDGALPGLWEAGSVTVGALIDYFRGGHTVSSARGLRRDRGRRLRRGDRAGAGGGRGGPALADQRPHVPLEGARPGGCPDRRRAVAGEAGAGRTSPASTGTWWCWPYPRGTAYRDAGRVLKRPSPAPGGGSEEAAPPPVAPAPPATSLEGHQVQDLADLVPDLIEASAGYRLEFQVRAVLTDAPDEVRARVEQLIEARLKADPAARDGGLRIRSGDLDARPGGDVGGVTRLPGGCGCLLHSGSAGRDERSTGYIMITAAVGVTTGLGVRLASRLR